MCPEFRPGIAQAAFQNKRAGNPMTPPDSEYQWPPATSRPLLHPLLTPVIKRQTQIGSTEHSVMQSASANLHPTTAPPSHPLSDRHRPIGDGRSPRSSMGCQQTACPRPTESIPSGCHRLAIPRRDRRVPVGGSKLQEHCVVGWTDRLEISVPLAMKVTIG